MLLSTHFIWTSIGYLSMYFIYTLKIPFFEKYRTRNVIYKIIIVESLAMGRKSSLVEN